MAVGSIITGLLGGVALFLYGLDRLTGSLNSVAGSRMQSLLATLTGHPLRGVASGALLTAVLQSSTLTTVLCVGFVSAGLINLRQATGVIIGANVGTTVTAQVIAFKVTALALPLIALGVAIRLSASATTARHLGSILLGLGLVFHGLEVMTASTAPLRDSPEFLQMMQELSTPWLGVLAGALFTALVQSSSASTGLVLVLASQKLISLEAGVAIILGANVGSCVTAIVAGWSRGQVARQAAAVHTIFNLSGALLWWLAIEQLTSLTLWVSGPDIPRQLANAHTIFNVSSAVLFLFLIEPLTRLVERLLPSRPTEPEPEPGQSLYLDPTFLAVPSMALDRVRLELEQLGQQALKATALAPQGAAALPHVLPLSKVKDEIVDYLRRLSQEEMTERETRQFEVSLVIADCLESVGAAVSDLVAWRQGSEASHYEGRSETLHREVERTLALAIQSLRQPQLAVQVRQCKDDIRALRDEALREAIQELDSQSPEALVHYRQRTTVVDELRRIYYLASRISRAVSRLHPEESATT